MNSIKEIRKKTGLTQERFAQKYGLPLRTVQKWERNGSVPPDYIPKFLDQLIFLESSELFLECYWKDEKVASVRLDEQFAYIERLTSHPVKQPFYADKISRLEFGAILEDRCWDKHRPDIKHLLSNIGLTEYNPYEICKRTHGKMHQDHIWFRFPGELLSYKDMQYV